MSGARHIDGVFVTRGAVVDVERHIEVLYAPSSTAVGTVTENGDMQNRQGRDMEFVPQGTIVKAKLVTDDKRRRNARYGQPFASDHYPVVITFQWPMQDEENTRERDAQSGSSAGAGSEL